jgi:hypothetical protein
VDALPQGGVQQHFTRLDIEEMVARVGSYAKTHELGCG